MHVGLLDVHRVEALITTAFEGHGPDVQHCSDRVVDDQPRLDLVLDSGQTDEEHANRKSHYDDNLDC